jgi:lipopolysaccharide transport system permease protein
VLSSFFKTEGVPPPRHLLTGLVQQLRLVVADLVRCRHILYTLTAVETRKKYSGSILGSLWYPLHALLLLGCYCFVYLVVFRMRYREFGTYSYVLFIFSGLVPYLGFSESVTSSVMSVRSNLTIVRNSVFPIELVPVKHVLAAFVPLLFSLLILLAMIAPTSHTGWHLLYLPVPLLSLFVLSLAVAWIASGVAVVVPDVAQVINIVLLLFMFVSPVGFALDMVPPGSRFLVYLNPMTYLIEAFRYAFLGVRQTPMWVDGIFLSGCVLMACVAAALFKRLSPAFSDYE